MDILNYVKGGDNMSAWLYSFLPVLIFTIIAIAVYNILRDRVLSKFHPNKWIILVIAVTIFFVPTLVSIYLKFNFAGSIWQYVQTGAFLIFIIWFFDISGLYTTGKKTDNTKNKDFKIKPKAKPNRVKKLKKEDNDTKKK